MAEPVAAAASQDPKREIGQAQEAQWPRTPDILQKQVAPHTNGMGSRAPNGSVPGSAPTQDTPLHATNGESTKSSAALDMQTPPELDQSWRESDANKSMGTLIDRLSQQCFVDLTDTLTKMSEMGISHQNGQPNGIAPQPLDTSPNSLSKKRTFMEFANGQRDRFIKTLVLSDWARKSEDMARLVDIKVWQQKQADAQREAIDRIGILKHEIRSFKLPNPNIEGALELLGTGKASRVPDLGYLPPKRLTAKRLLRTLQSMNVTLATRLNLHQELPPHFNDFSIADGRATFRVAGEFEVDLSVADDEEVASPFYFIDFRFLFKPAPNVLDEQLRAALESRTNTELAGKGLQGCYNFLHNFVLTHKINVLKDQSQKMLAEKWFGCIRLERTHRVLTIQYWTGIPGRKSWLELGVSTGKQPHRLSRRPPTSQVSVRWFRRGQLVEDEKPDIDWQHLNVERILSNITAMHASWILRQMLERLQVLAGAGSKLEAKLECSNSAPENCSLKLSLPGLRGPILIRFEPATGNISISPPTERTNALERTLNTDPNPDMSRFIAQLLCKSVQDRVDNMREFAGWEPFRYAIRPDNFKTILGTDFFAYRAYTCNSGWSDQWAILVTYSLSGERWRIVQLEHHMDQAGQQPFKTITSAHPLPIDGRLAHTATISRGLLLQIEKMAVAEVSMAVLLQQLSSMHIQYRFAKLAPLTFEDGSVHVRSDLKFGIVFPGSTLLKDSMGTDITIDSLTLTHGGFRLAHSGDGEIAEMRHELRTTVSTSKLKHLRDYLTTKSRDADVAMNASGALALRFRTLFGQPYVEQILSRLRSAERLDRYLAIIEAFKFTCTTASFQKISFIYNRSPELSATLTFSGKDGSLPAKLKLEPMGANPHHRTRVMMERTFNTPRSVNGFATLCKSLFHSLPILPALGRIEAADPARKTVTIFIRNPLQFTLAYKAPLPEWSFSIEMRDRKEDTKFVAAWRIGSGKTRQELEKSDFGRALLELARHRSGTWWGLEDGVLFAMSTGIEDAIEKLNEVVHKFKAEDGSVKKEGTPKVDAKPQPEQQKQQQQQQPLQNGKPVPNTGSQQKSTLNANMAGNRNNNSTNDDDPDATAQNNNSQPKQVKTEVIELD